MSQEIVTTVQKTTGLLFVGTGPLAFLTQNATAITALVSVVTGTIFAVCAIMNMLTNRQNRAINKAASERNAAANEKSNEINERDIRAKVLKEIEEEKSGYSE